MIILIALFGFWFAELSTLPQRLNILTGKTMYVINCTKCLSFWIGLSYSFYIYRHIGEAVLLAGVCSLIGMVVSRIYYKLLS